MNMSRPDPLPLSYSTSIETEAVGLSEISDHGLMELANAASPVFVDARSPLEFSMGHIPGAVNIPPSAKGDMLEAAAAEIPRGETVIVYCDGLTCGKSRTVGEKLLQLGFHDVRVYPGGMDGWIGLGMDLEVQ